MTERPEWRMPLIIALPDPDLSAGDLTVGWSVNQCIGYLQGMDFDDVNVADVRDTLMEGVAKGALRYSDNGFRLPTMDELKEFLGL